MSIIQRMFSVPPICEREKITLSFRLSSLTFAYRPRRKAAFSAEWCCPSQKIAFSRVSDGASERSAYARRICPARGLCCCERAKIAFSWSSWSVALLRTESSTRAAGLLVALLGECRLDARQQRGAVAQRRRLGVAALLGDEQAAGAGEIVVLVQRERRPVEGVPRPSRVGVAAREIAVQVRGARVVAAIERLARRPPQRVGRVLRVPQERW